MFKNIFQKIYNDETRKTPVNDDLRRRLAEQLSLPDNDRAHTALRGMRVPYRIWSMLGAVGVSAIIVMVSVTLLPPKSGTPLAFGDKIDDWQYSQDREDDGLNSVSSSSAMLSSSGGGLFDALSSSGGGGGAANMMLRESATLGFAVGGAKDANAFRMDIENNYTPFPTDITYEGLFYEYFFDTGKEKPCDELFCPSYATAVTPDPISGKTDYYLSVGLDSGIKEEDFERKPLNLVVVLDISGSMGSSLDRYYYDGGVGTWDEEEASKSKMDVAKDALVDLLDHLHPEDRLGIVLFDDTAVVAKPLRLVGETDMGSVEAHIDEITPQGGTDMSAGMDLGTDLFDDVADEGYENRIILLTDAQPNTGDLSKSGMLGRMEKNADNNLYSTFIGIGVDFQTELIEAITKTRGANYYTVRTNEEFRTRMDEGFDFMVTPLVFDLALNVEADGFDIAQVYGSPEADAATGEVMYVNTLFPSLTEGGETKGGIVLLKLTKTGDDPKLSLHVSYKDRDGDEHDNDAEVTFDASATSYDNSGIRKAVWLARYADMLKNWMIDTRAEDRPSMLVNLDDGIVVPPDMEMYPLSEWEQQSVPLFVSNEYRAYFTTFLGVFAGEVDAIGDDTMQQEIDILRKLSE